MNFWIKIAIVCVLFYSFLRSVYYVSEIKDEIERLKCTQIEMDKNIDKNLTLLCNIQQNFFLHVIEYLRDKK